MSAASALRPHQPQDAPPAAAHHQAQPEWARRGRAVSMLKPIPVIVWQLSLAITRSGDVAQNRATLPAARARVEFFDGGQCVGKRGLVECRDSGAHGVFPA